MVRMERSEGSGQGAPDRRRRRPRRALLLTGAALLAGCSLVFKAPRVTIADVQVASVGLVGGIADVALRVENRNGFALTSEEIQYRLSFADGDAPGGWRVLSEGESIQRVTIAARDTAEVHLEVPFRFTDVGRALGSVLSEGSLSYRLEGEVKFDAPITAVRVPFAREGSFSP